MTTKFPFFPCDWRRVFLTDEKEFDEFESLKLSFCPPHPLYYMSQRIRVWTCCTFAPFILPWSAYCQKQLTHWAAGEEEVDSWLRVLTFPTHNSQRRKKDKPSTLQNVKQKCLSPSYYFYPQDLLDVLFHIIIFPYTVVIQEMGRKVKVLDSI